MEKWLELCAEIRIAEWMIERALENTVTIRDCITKLQADIWNVKAELEKQFFTEHKPSTIPTKYPLSIFGKPLWNRAVIGKAKELCKRMFANVTS